MKGEEYLGKLLNKLRNGTITRAEIKQLRGYMERPEGEHQIKHLMDEHWKEILKQHDQLNEDDDSCTDLFSLN
ncbi:hypothetical protein LS482_05580 [Sinomicrobium kalidii]|uniref:hypothetical protein n=1 Tax=Sinomicrobium kalidii TaxID=2900738 RepID=UPI001E2C9D99|nr:hypothetical protein [Sinomicrobium kalidii]UGU17341.1 hypothetical protein LS482_05580 [Sinomicrobium kalidii]